MAMVVPVVTDRFIGIPYVAHGRDYDAADCWGLVYLFYRDVLRRPVPSYVTEMEGRQFRVREIAHLMTAEREANWTETAEPQEGDVVSMRSGPHHSHVGIYLTGGKLLHADEPGPSCIERLDALHIKNRIVGFYRLA